MNPIKSYAQNFEDVMLWRALGHVENGRYIDIGAQDPLIDSVSMAFYEKGWRGIHVEPVAAYAAKLRAERPGETIIQSAVGAQRGTLTFHEMPGTGLSTLDESIASVHEAAGFEVVRTVVPVITLDDVLACAPEGVHWMKIDVEGVEEQVLRSWSGSDLLPWIVVVESVSPLNREANHHSWEPFLLNKGYRFVYFDGLNRFYVSPEHGELVESFSVGPNCFDGFALSGTATSTFGGELLGALHQARAAAAASGEQLHARDGELEARARQAEVDKAQGEQERATLLARIELMAAKASTLEDQSRRLEEHASRIEERAQWATKHAAQLERHTQWLEQHSSRFEHHMTWLEQSSKELVQENQRLQSQVDALLSSSSWKLTAPLRFLRRALGGAQSTSQTKLQLKIWLKPRILRVIEALKRSPALWRAAKLPMALVPSLTNRLRRMADSDVAQTQDAAPVIVPARPSFSAGIVISRLKPDAIAEGR